VTRGTVLRAPEWVETVEAGWNVLAGWQPERIVHAVKRARSPSESAAPYGDGRAAERIASPEATEP